MAVVAQVNEDKPPSPWAGVSEEQWNDWLWQLRNRITTLEGLEKVLALTPAERRAIQEGTGFRFSLTPYFSTLLEDDPNGPIRRQVIPHYDEIRLKNVGVDDPLSEDHDSPVPGLVHRYPDRVLIFGTDQCASYCRYCTRKRAVGVTQQRISFSQYEQIMAYLRAHTEVRDVLISGGDPLILADSVLDHLLGELRRIPHIEVVRLGSRVPIFLPQRITDCLCNVLKKYHPLYINVHVNHPAEMTLEARTALGKLADAGIPLGSQTVLLAGINDCPNVMKRLMHLLVMSRVRPYYIYQCDPVEGSYHFRTPVSKGIEIIEHLRGHTTGFAVPTYVVDAPGGGGKIPLMPNYLLAQSEDHVVLRNFEGVITTYHNPRGYVSHDPASCQYCQSAQPAQGVAKLLAGQAEVLEPPQAQHPSGRGINARHPLPQGNGHSAPNGHSSQTIPLTVLVEDDKWATK
ncbi:MAG: lysine 2,3-aminomutase [Deinococcus sp.]|nr:lysine 2,3-aminomutase [Deinococcus sp.]